MPSARTSSSPSALPTFYYVMFGIIEPLITFASLFEGIFYPEKVINRHVRWANGFVEPSGISSTTAHAIVYQMVVAHAIIGFVNASVLRAIRRLPSSAVQEKIAKSLLIPLAFGDLSYLFGTFYGIGDVRWKSTEWPQVLWLNVILGVGIFIPRVCWLLGVRRYVAARDSRLDSKD